MKLSSLQKGLVGHWTMSQDSLKGSLLADKTPYENDGTIYGATFTTDRKGKANSAMSFDGVSNHISLLNSLGLTRNISKLTLSCWTNIPLISLSSTAVFISFGRGGGGGARSQLLIRNGKYVIAGRRLDSDTYTEVNGGITSVGWHLVTGMFDYANKSVFLYLDGVKIAENTDFLTAGNTSDTDSTGAKIGTQYDATFPFNGSIDDVRIYNRALSQAEITTLYNSYNSKIIL